MRSSPRITPIAITQYMEKFKPTFTKKEAERRLRLAASNPVGNGISIDGIPYFQIRIGNCHDGVCYAGLDGNEVVGILTKQEYGEGYRTL